MAAPGIPATSFQPSIPFPSTLPNGLLEDGHLELNETIDFDPSIHLQYEQPEFLVDLSFQKRAYPYDGKDAFPGLAFTGPFRLLSDEGVKVWRGIMDNQSSNDRIRQVPLDRLRSVCVCGSHPSLIRRRS